MFARLFDFKSTFLIPFDGLTAVFYLIIPCSLSYSLLPFPPFCSFPLSLHVRLVSPYLSAFFLLQCATAPKHSRDFFVKRTFSPLATS